METENPPPIHVPEIRGNKPSAEADFGQAVRAGLMQGARSLPAVWHYDDLGSTLFEAICLLPEYDLTRIEDDILIKNSRAVLDTLGAPGEILELGSGVASKTIALVQAGMQGGHELRYRPIDVSEAALDAAERRIHAQCPGVSYSPLVGDYFSWFKRGFPRCDGRRLVIFLGSNIGNYADRAGHELLQLIRNALKSGDGFLLGAALKRPAPELIDAYDDPTGVTAAFNRNVLGRINRELGGDFALRNFRHQVDYDEATGIIDSYLVATKAQRVQIRALELTLDFAAEERIHTESSCKYTLAGVRKLGEDAGFRYLAHWTDDAQRFCDALFVVE
jgi:dimethylhistidine N-methyltransferase